MQETWKAVQGYEGLYEVSDLGRVRSLVDKYGRKRELILKLVEDSRIYLYVNLCKNCIVKKHSVHRLVALAFIKGRDLFHDQVNHINENKTDNRAVNLEWVSASENINHGTRNKRTGEANSIPIVQLTLDYQFVAKWPSSHEAGRSGFKQGNVTKCCQHKYKYAYNYRWFYLSEYEQICFKVITVQHPFRLPLPYRV